MGSSSPASSMSSSSSSSSVLSSLRGKVLAVPPSQVKHGENSQPCNILHDAWTPYKSNLQMQGIKIVEHQPVPCTGRENAFEDTMMLIDLVRQHMQSKNADKKDALIRDMAMEMKKRTGPGSGSSNIPKV